jgi:hypothetical protein
MVTAPPRKREFVCKDWCASGKSCLGDREPRRTLSSREPLKGR